MKYYLQTNAGMIEEVCERIFQNRKYALDENGSTRYNEFVAMKDNDGVITLKWEGSVLDFAYIMRVLGVGEYKAAFTGGFFNTPETIPFKKGNSSGIWDKSGQAWKKA